MNFLFLNAPSEARRSKAKTEEYIKTNLALISAPEVLANKQKRLEQSLGELLAADLEANLATVDFSEAR